VFGRGADSSFSGRSSSNAIQQLITYGGGPGGYRSTDNGLLGGSGGGGNSNSAGSGIGGHLMNRIVENPQIFHL
jgi:hypothetical protein